MCGGVESAEQAFAETLLPVFHLEQFDPEADKA